MTGVDVALLWNLDVFVLTTITGMGGWLRVIAGEESGWLAIWISIATHFFNCVGLLAYYLH